jgi:hypothetical protein
MTNGGTITRNDKKICEAISQEFYSWELREENDDKLNY